MAASGNRPHWKKRGACTGSNEAPQRAEIVGGQDRLEANADGSRRGIDDLADPEIDVGQRERQGRDILQPKLAAVGQRMVRANRQHDRFRNARQSDDLRVRLDAISQSDFAPAIAHRLRDRG